MRKAGASICYKLRGLAGTLRGLILESPRRLNGCHPDSYRDLRGLAGTLSPLRAYENMHTIALRTSRDPRIRVWAPTPRKSPQVPANPAMPLNNMELRCGDSSISVPAESPQVPADCNDSETLWVSTDLKTWCPRDPGFIARDCQINDRCYRRLDPEYFAWLKLRMHAVKAAVDAGRVPAEAFDELRQRFNDVQVRAIGLSVSRVLLDALRTLDLEKYRPPLPDEFERIKWPSHSRRKPPRNP